MLPFLKNKNSGVAGVIMKTRTPDQPEPQEDNENEGLEACLSDLKSALDSGDHKAAARAFKAAFQVCENSPEEEQSSNDYDDLNEQAAKESE